MQAEGWCTWQQHRIPCSNGGCAAICIFKSLIQRHKQADNVALATIIVHAFESVIPCARNPHPCREVQVYLLSRTDKSFDRSGMTEHPELFRG